MLYIYESVPGYVLITLKILSWFWFLYAIGFTLKHYPNKVVFYVPLIVVYTLWWVWTLMLAENDRWAPRLVSSSLKLGGLILRITELMWYISYLTSFDRFWAGTGVALAAISTIDKWMREKVVQGASLMINFIGHLVFLVCTNPLVPTYHPQTSAVISSAVVDTHLAHFSQYNIPLSYKDNTGMCYFLPPLSDIFSGFSFRLWCISTENR